VTFITALVVLAALLLASWLGWRLISERRTLPCPTSLAWLLDNPFTMGYHSTVISRLELAPGLHVLDAGCGPGHLTTAVAAAVGPEGRVLALDLQPGMIAKAQARAARASLSNIDYLIAPLGAGKLPDSHFDRALLVTVLGEIPNKVAALEEIRSSLKPGGFLSITEVLPDPHYQSMRAIMAAAENAGFHIRNKFGNPFMFTVNLEGPLGG